MGRIKNLFRHFKDTPGLLRDISRRHKSRSTAAQFAAEPITQAIEPRIQNDAEYQPKERPTTTSSIANEDTTNPNEVYPELERRTNDPPAGDTHNRITPHLVDETDEIDEPFVWGKPWAEAYRRVKEDPEHSQLLMAFERYLSKEGQTTVNDQPSSEAACDNSDARRLGTIRSLAKSELQALNDAHLCFWISGRPIVVRDAVLKAIQLVSKFKLLIERAISAEPHAALAWAGIITIFPILENAFQQDEDAADGLNSIMFLLIRYQSVQDSILSSDILTTSEPGSTRQILRGIKDTLVDIYEQVYIYQIRFILHFTRHKFLRVLRDTIVADGWKERWETIKSMSEVLDQAVQDRVSSRTMKIWKEASQINTRTEQIQALQKQTMEAVQTGYETDLLLSLPFAGNATFDSAEVLGIEAPCLPGTQHRILSDIQRWAESPTSEPILWLYGMAGTGKTSVALTVAKALNDRQPFTHEVPSASTAFLGASFFFKQGDATRNGIKTFFPTLARCLVQSFPDLKPGIVRAINDELGIGTKAPQQQFDHLIVNPVSKLDRNSFVPIRPVVVVDALDECMERAEINLLIHLLTGLEKLRQVQLRFLITSRRDDHIVRSFELHPSLYRSLPLGKIEMHVEKHSTKDDITLYLEHRLTEIAHKHQITPEWIDEAGINQLREKADGLFIYAATACRFLDHDFFYDEKGRQERLDQILQDDGERESPQHKVDEIYIKVLSNPKLDAPPKARDRFFADTGKLLGFIAVLFEPLPVPCLGKLVLLQREALDSLLKWLHSILSIPQDETSPVGLVHLSFRDFILDQHRPKQLPFRVNEAAMHNEVFGRCLDLMSAELHQDICNLVRPGILASEVSKSEKDQNIPQYLRYACRYWVDHLSKVDNDCAIALGLCDGGAIHAFLQKSLLFWLETMSLIRELPATILIINHLQSLVKSSEHPQLSSFIDDAKRFVSRNRWIIGHAPLQIYASSLTFSPRTSIIRSQFQHLRPSQLQNPPGPWVIQEPATEENWTPALDGLEGHESCVRCIAFSPVDDFIASAASDCTIRLWNSTTGTEQFKFHGDEYPTCITFSPDGRFIACAFWFKQLIRVIEFAKGRVIDLWRSAGQVTFLPQSNTMLASLSHLGKLQIWDIEEGQEIHIVDILSFNYSIFSPNGAFAFLISQKNRVEIWSTEKRELISKYEFPDEEIFSKIAVSMDGKAMVSASFNNTVTSRDLTTGRERHKFHYSRKKVNSLTFSPADEETVAIAFGDGDIELRNADTWTLIRRFQHYFPCRSLEFSRDGKILGSTADSAMDDPQIQLWDMMVNITSETVDKASLRLINAFSFWPGTDYLVVNRFSLNGYRIWDTAQEYDESLPTNNLESIEVSPDGKLASLAGPQAVQLWDWQFTKQYDLGVEGIERIIFSPDSSRMALLLTQSGVRVIDSMTFEEVTTLDVKDVSTFEFSPNGQVAVTYSGSASDRELTQLWDLESGRQLTTLLPFGWFEWATFSPDGQFVAVIGRLKRQGGRFVTVLLETMTGREVDILPNEDGIIVTVAFQPGTNSIAITSFDPEHIKIVVWEIAPSGMKTRLFIRDKFSSDGNLFERTMVEHQHTLAISATGMLATTILGMRTPGCTVYLWDITTDSEIGRYDFSGEPRFLNFSDDLRSLDSDRGRLPLPLSPPHEDDINPEEVENSHRSCLSVGAQWVMQGHDRILWLPPGYVTHDVAVQGGAIVLKHARGLKYIKFDLEKIPRSANRGRLELLPQPE